MVYLDSVKKKIDVKDWEKIVNGIDDNIGSGDFGAAEKELKGFLAKLKRAKGPSRMRNLSSEKIGKIEVLVAAVLKVLKGAWFPKKMWAKRALWKVRDNIKNFK